MSSSFSPHLSSLSGPSLFARPFPWDLATVRKIADKYPTPFYLYDEAAIRANAQRLNKAFAWNEGFKEYFAVKATPNPHIMQIFRSENIGADCSSMAELILAERCAYRGEDIMFTSNNTPDYEYQYAHKLGAILNLDDITHIPYVKAAIGMPELVCFRYNPGPRCVGNVIIGKPVEAKYGFTMEQLFDGYKQARDMGAMRFGLHAMIVSNSLSHEELTANASMLFELAANLMKSLDIAIEFVNLGGGIGIPYRPEQQPVDYESLSQDIQQSYQNTIVDAGLPRFRVLMENGRCMTGPYGYLITQVRHEKHIYKNYVGVDASMANLMRPGMYGAYHHISVLGKEEEVPSCVVDVVGSLCENNDKFAVDRPLPKVERGDFLVIHDAGAHGHAMGFQYNGKLRCAELLMKPSGEVKMIRRAETIEDYFQTLEFPAV